MLATRTGTDSIVFANVQSELSNDVAAQDIAIFRIACKVLFFRFLVDHRLEKLLFVDLFRDQNFRGEKNRLANGEQIEERVLLRNVGQVDQLLIRRNTAPPHLHYAAVSYSTLADDALQDGGFS